MFKTKPLGPMPDVPLLVRFRRGYSDSGGVAACFSRTLRRK